MIVADPLAVRRTASDVESGGVHAMTPILGQLKVAYYGDDFTGATDTLATAARAGLRTMLFLRVPDATQVERAGELDCLGIAGAARSMTPEEMRAELAPVAAFFGRLPAPLLHYKVCSTFDSSVGIGNIATAIDALRDIAPNELVAIVGGQPNLGRYCVFGNLFARAGVGGAVYRIDRHPTMSRHPVTPMHEGDLRRHLGEQGLAVIPSMDYREYEDGGKTLEVRLQAALAQRPDAVLFDIARTQDLATVGRSLWRRAQQARMLAVGPSSILQALAAHWATTGMTPEVPGTAPAVERAQGPVFVLAGSLSPVTARQVKAARSYVRVDIDARKLTSDHSAHREEVLGQAGALLAAGRNVIAVTACAGAGVSAASSGRVVALATAELVHAVLARAPVRRLGIAGGDTSSHAVLALGAWGLSYLSQLAEGVALCRLHSDDAAHDGLEVMLKGGQMGPDDVLEHLVHGLPLRGNSGTTHQLDIPHANSRS